MEAGWLIHELAQRTRYCHFPPLVATCTNEDKGECSAILRHRPTSGTCSINLLQRVRDNQSEGIRPCFIDDSLDRHGASGEIEGTLGRLEHRLA